jgi:SulP family sulfate permease
LIFTAQLTHFVGESWIMYVMTAVSLAIIYLFPLISKVIPSPLVAIIFMTIVAVTTGATVRTVGDMGQLTEALPMFMLPDIPLTFETLAIIFPYSIALAFVGLLESLLTAQIVDEMTDTDSNKNKEAKGQGLRISRRMFWRYDAMIGQSGINIKSGGRGRLDICSGAFLMVLIVLNDVLIKIPMAALVAVAIMVSIGTFDWFLLKRLNRAPSRMQL